MFRVVEFTWTRQELGVRPEELRANLKLLEGRPYDTETLQRDTREIVRAYSKQYGYIYLPNVDVTTEMTDLVSATRAYQAPSTSYVVVLDAKGRVVYTGVGADQAGGPVVRQERVLRLEAGHKRGHTVMREITTRQRHAGRPAHPRPRTLH